MYIQVYTDRREIRLYVRGMQGWDKRYPRDDLRPSRQSRHNIPVEDAGADVTLLCPSVPVGVEAVRYFWRQILRQTEGDIRNPFWAYQPLHGLRTRRMVLMGL